MKRVAWRSSGIVFLGAVCFLHSVCFALGTLEGSEGVEEVLLLPEQNVSTSHIAHDAAKSATSSYNEDEPAEQTLVQSREEFFSEELLLRPLPDGKVLTHFQFTSQLQKKSHEHHKIFPKSIDQLVRKYSIKEMELSFTQGRWDYQQWGSSDAVSRISAKPPGVELWVWFDLPESEVDASWRNLTHAISGLFCASVNHLEASAAVARPAFLFRPDLDVGSRGESLCGSGNGAGGMQSCSRRPGVLGPVRYGALPREPVCTENLTPWLKLLPCRDQAGLTTLLDRPRVYGGHYHSLRVHVRAGDPVRGPDTSGIGKPKDLNGALKPSIELIQTLTLVHQPSLRYGIVGGTRLQPNWTLSGLFGKGVAGPCAVADTSRVFVEIESGLVQAAGLGRPGFGLEEVRKASQAQGSEGGAPEPGLGQQGGEFVLRGLQRNAAFRIVPMAEGVLWGGQEGSSRLLSYDVARYNSSKPFSVSFRWLRPLLWAAELAPLRVNWVLAGYGNERGGLALILKQNSDANSLRRACSSGVMGRLGAGGEAGVEVIVFQLVPWWVRLYLHSLRVSLTFNDSAPRPSSSSSSSALPLLAFASAVRISPAEDRRMPALLEVAMRIPCNVTTLLLLADFDKGFLQVDEHPPDASRGLDIPAAVVVFPTLSNSPVHAQQANHTPLTASLQAPKPVRLYTESLLVRMPIPDFSMPYNVTTLTCTALAMLFGSVFNVLRRRFGEEERAQDVKKAPSPPSGNGVGLKTKDKLIAVISSLRSGGQLHRRLTIFAVILITGIVFTMYGAGAYAHS